MRRAEFLTRYQEQATAGAFVDGLLQNARQLSGADLSTLRSELMNAYSAGTDLDSSRARAIRGLADHATFKQATYNAAFVLTEYFSYLRRDPDEGGYAFWRDVLDHDQAGNYRGMFALS